MRDFLSIREAAEYLEVKVQAISQAMKRGTLTYKIINKKKYTTIEWIDDYRSKPRNTDNVRINGLLVYDRNKGEYSVDDAAKMTGIKRSDFYRFIYIGKVKSKKKGEYHVISQSEISRLIQERQEKTA